MKTKCSERKWKCVKDWIKGMRYCQVELSDIGNRVRDCNGEDKGWEIAEEKCWQDEKWWRY